MTQAEVTGFLEPKTESIAYVVADAETARAAIIDSVWDFEPRSGRTSTVAADRVLAFVRERGLTVDWHLETHIHADHLSAASYLKAALGGGIAIGAHVSAVQRIFAPIFNLTDAMPLDGSQFDSLLDDGAELSLGNLGVRVIHTPGHTPACVSYLIGDALFCGDTMLMPDFGTARCDFPGGSAPTLFASVRRLLALPPETRVFVGHDYAPGRPHAWATTIADQRRANKHVHDGIALDEFVHLRQERDRQLALPELILPAVQVNIQAGRLPPEEANGIAYLRIPLNLL